ncbi:UDP-N-acetylmuramoylalanine--D-glutamate ligase [Breznakibacter xylanolyticus]|uniref:UDP-N-acetylmuramoylalanine--D-glutamate ligase n=1 Tax=Breznakibacter xylanolyticus TaxID=990 RepID=A0A2W7N6E1_9BACT|nr:UDP-N-acetylmuramoyl-L-alanine--D-glutamate ligase [Breznakibacter xylanolyticus]PZX12424.1 UDP-N-acetylmuramoylalanine--D-glutamate ligase [Breznakibacter xylanolyticus]
MKRIVILGAGESGTGAALLARQQGFDVFVSDMGVIQPRYCAELDAAGVPYEQGQHTEALILNADEVIKSPGIPDKAPLVKALHAQGTPVISEIEFAGRYTRARKICITGSNGKTTTTLLTFHLLQGAGIRAALAGNVGTSLARQVASGNEPDWYVIELSSFQLDGMFDFKADVAVLTNITPDHLDRYDYQMQNYVDSKFRIVQNMTPSDYFIYCADDEIIEDEMKHRQIAATCLPFSYNHKVDEGAYVDQEQFHVTYKNHLMSILFKDLSLQGRHNIYNSMAASIAAQVASIRKDVIRQCLMSFQGVEHRLEKVLSVRAVEYINDSKATNVNSTWYALECMTRPVVWIAGGVDKGNDYSTLLPLAKEKVKALICMGKDNEKLKQSFGGVVPVIKETSSMKETLDVAYQLAEKGDVVLLSPACASFDLFKNYEDRGQQFKECVRNL